MADRGDAPEAVDETPISPSRPNPGRKNSLEYHLGHRPDRQELVDSMWPVVIATSRGRSGAELTLHVWCLENILPASTAAPGLQAHQKEVSLGAERPCYLDGPLPLDPLV